MDQKNIEFVSNSVKQFCTNVHITNMNDGTFLISMLSGQSGIVYALSPQHMKSFYLAMSHHMGKYEKEKGEIKSDWVPGIQSPLQAPDLKKPEGGIDSKKR